MENLIREVRNAVDFHAKYAISKYDVLFGDEKLLGLIIDNYQNDYNYNILRDEVQAILNLELSNDIADDYDASEYELVSNDEVEIKIDNAIAGVLAQIENDFVRSELNRVSSGKKKMLRSKMFLKIQTEPNYDYAALIELFHLATLIQDDVIDKATMRRYKQTINDKYNDRIAVLISDYLLVHIGYMLQQFGKARKKDIKKFDEGDARDEYYQELIKVFLNKLLYSEKEVEQITTVDQYEEYAINKTARFFEVALVSGLVAERDEQISLSDLKEVGDFGTKFGLLFQKVDDLLDYISDSEQSGKDSTDIANGVNNYIMLNINDHSLEDIKKMLQAEAESLSSSKYYELFSDEIRYLTWRTNG